MRRIQVTDDLVKTVKDFNDNLFVNSRCKNFELPASRLNHLYKRVIDKRQKRYIQKIQDNYINILNADPEEMKELKEEFDRIIPYSDKLLKENIPKGGREFYKEIISALRYEDLREREFLIFLKKSSIKTCVYCNMHYTLAIEKKYYGKKKKRVKEISGKLQLDHYYPKSKYPFLATSFFNLYPTCANCNIAKSDKEALFELYTREENPEVFTFWLCDESLLNYWTHLDHSHLELHLKSIDGNEDLLLNHNERFQIQSMYEQHLDVVEELVYKAKANPESYKKMLSESFSELFHDPAVIDRMILGTYSKPEEVLKRPLAKLTQDLARQLKILST